MHFKKFISILTCFSVLISVLPLCVSAVTENEDEEYVDGEVVICSSKEICSNDDYLYCASDSSKVYVDFDNVGIDSIEEIENYTEDSNMYIAKIDGDVKKLCAKLNRYGNIIAEPNYIYYSTSFTMPGEIADSSSDYTDYQKWYMEDVLHVPQAWQENNVTGSGVTIAVIDNGYKVDAEDFPQNLWKNSQGTVGWNVCTKSDDIGPIYKKSGRPFTSTDHGSNVAGIIGMANDNAGGIGIAYGAQLMLIQAAKYFSETTEPHFTSADVANAIDFAIENEADIINLSLGSKSNSDIIAASIKRANNAGILCVAAAGNSGNPTSDEIFYPAAYSTVVGVMGISKSFPTRLSTGTNYDTDNGKYYNIAAPGDGILGCGTRGNDLMSGTSQAAPIVSAIAALYMEKYPERTIERLKQDMLSSADQNIDTCRSSPYKFKAIDASAFLGDIDEHIWTDWTVTTEETCTEAGVRNRSCTSCGKTETRVTPALQHDYTVTVIEPTCVTDGYSQYICKNCSNTLKKDYVSSLGHSYGDWEITAYPSEKSQGTLVKMCTRCLMTESKNIDNVIRNCDFTDNLISGFNVSTSVEAFLSDNVIPSEATVTVIPKSGNTIGTDTIVSVSYPTSEIINYNVVIFGDVNGDGRYDGMDAVIADCLANGLLSYDSLTQAQLAAADCNHDGVIDVLDVKILQQAGVLLSNVDQSKSSEELLQTSSQYVEYLNLIDQSIESKPEIKSETKGTKFTSFFIRAFNDLIDIIKSAFVYFKFI